MLTKEERWVLTKTLHNSRRKAEELLAQEQTTGYLRKSLLEEIELIDSIRSKLSL